MSLTQIVTAVEAERAAQVVTRENIEERINVLISQVVQQLEDLRSGFREELAERDAALVRIIEGDAPVKKVAAVIENNTDAG